MSIPSRLLVSAALCGLGSLLHARFQAAVGSGEPRLEDLAWMAGHWTSEESWS